MRVASLNVLFTLRHGAAARSTSTAPNATAIVERLKRLRGQHQEQPNAVNHKNSQYAAVWARIHPSCELGLIK
jgi:hypothetical protein